MNSSTTPRISFTEAARFWAWLGLVSFGGPAGQISLMYQELVERRRWISPARFTHALHYCMLLPGPEAQQLATYLGWLMHNTRGGVLAGVCFILPSFVLLSTLGWLYLRFGNHPLMHSAFDMLKPVVLAMILHAAWKIGQKTMEHPLGLLLALGSLAGVSWLQLPVPAVLAIAALTGWLYKMPASSGHKTGQTSAGPAIIDDHSPLPEHARWQWPRAARIVVCFLLLWSAPLLTLIAALGWTHAYTQMGWFFTKAAFMTFGGAYAVMPYVADAAVRQFGWISGAQMLDGMALGETTPGPLIMIVCFIGFLAGGQLPLAALGMAPSGLLAAAIVVWFTFLPSFLFILAGAPLIETTRHLPSLHSPLNAIGAAVSGLILHLTLYFAVPVLFPQGWQAPDWSSILICIAAAALLFSKKINALPLIGLALLTGVLRAGWHMLN
ncbi:chromate efflux transporter [Undibacterium luofuense]|uniref:Chromate efflux transporter n=1 Tax=Undibacterium luofuense TaxID=2828733 RepID=A0A941DKQ7_9BURK|nr:chromate efflux transporter [Undibacterium luofuense]MBR7781844.1 chromate efflux transporter [Undibacterium luofuense]